MTFTVVIRFWCGGVGLQSHSKACLDDFKAVFFYHGDASVQEAERLTCGSLHCTTLSRLAFRKFSGCITGEEFCHLDRAHLLPSCSLPVT